MRRGFRRGAFDHPPYVVIESFPGNLSFLFPVKEVLDVWIIIIDHIAGQLLTP